MSSWIRRPWSLQTRLVAAFIGLLIVVGLLVGTISVLALRQNLVSRLDGQVAATLRFATNPNAPAPGNDDNPDGFRRSGTVLLVADGRVVQQAAYVAADGTVATLSTTQQKTLLGLRPGAEPVTVYLGALGDYRAAAVQNRFGQTVIAGLSLADVTATTTNLLLIIAGVTLATVLAGAVVSAGVVRVALRPLERVAATASRVSELPLSRGAVSLAERVPDAEADPRTEVGQVGAALNRMLGHVEAALVARQASEEQVRRFVADASHELRTPLASIRGYSELTRRGDYELPPDVVRALSRIESESVRMTSLVEDLLLLARLDEGQDLVFSQVDLASLLVDAVSDAAVSAPDHEFSLDAPEHPVLIDGDGPRLHQVLANLLGNAARHTPEGTSVVATLVDEDADVVVTVQDDGPGIPENLRSRLFQRFARGDTSRSRQSGSTGLGLAIVAAVVEAHRGEVSAESEPGSTVFTVRLPKEHLLHGTPLGVPESGDEAALAD